MERTNTMKRRGTFFAGVATTLLVLALGTTALAATGNVSFNFANIAVDGETKIAAGTTIAAANGQQVPGSILYVDGAGGKTNYLPIRAISDLLGEEIGYDPATQTVHLGKQPPTTQVAFGGRWQKEINGRDLTYFCEEEGHTYSAPPTFRPTWEKDGWALTKIKHDTRNYQSDWTYRGAEGEFTLSCANPSSAGIGRQMNSASVIENGQRLIIQGNAAEYYQDGKASVLAWENADGVFFFLHGTNTAQKLLTEVAESVRPCGEQVANRPLKWLPKGYWMMDRYEIADTVQEYWVQNGVALSWMYSAKPLGVPAGESSPVEIQGAAGRYWAAEEPYEDGHATPPPEMPSISVTQVTIPGGQEMNTLSWQDPNTGVHFRLQSILDQDTMLRIAGNVR